MDDLDQLPFHGRIGLGNEAGIGLSLAGDVRPLHSTGDLGALIGQANAYSTEIIQFIAVLHGCLPRTAKVVAAV